EEDNGRSGHTADEGTDRRPGTGNLHHIRPREGRTAPPVGERDVRRVLESWGRLGRALPRRAVVGRRGGPGRPASAPSAARSSSAMLILVIFSIACVARWDRAGSGSVNSWNSRVGTICQDRPHRSLSQPHWLGVPPSESAAQSRSTSAWSWQAIWNDT